MTTCQQHSDAVVGGYHYHVTVSHHYASWEMKSVWIEAILHEAITFDLQGSPKTLKVKTHNCQANCMGLNERASMSVQLYRMSICGGLWFCNGKSDMFPMWNKQHEKGTKKEPGSIRDAEEVSVLQCPKLSLYLLCDGILYSLLQPALCQGFFLEMTGL